MGSKQVVVALVDELLSNAGEAITLDSCLHMEDPSNVRLPKS